ncbi:hypothetical protein V8E51_000569 [Hyaloscypha variabilis]
MRKVFPRGSHLRVKAWANSDGPPGNKQGLRTGVHVSRPGGPWEFQTLASGLARQSPCCSCATTASQPARTWRMCDEPTGWEERAFQPAQLLLAAGMDGQTIAVIGASHGGCEWWRAVSVVTGTGGQSRAGQEGTGFRGAASWALGSVGVYDECLLPPPSVRTAVGSGDVQRCGVRRPGGQEQRLAGSVGDWPGSAGKCCDPRKAHLRRLADSQTRKLAAVQTMDPEMTLVAGVEVCRSTQWVEPFKPWPPTLNPRWAPALAARSLPQSLCQTGTLAHTDKGPSPLPALPPLCSASGRARLSQGAYQKRGPYQETRFLKSPQNASWQATPIRSFVLALAPFLSSTEAATVWLVRPVLAALAT